MGILNRFKDIMSSNVNAALDKMENPEKMIDQYLINAKRDLAQVRQETANVMAEEKRAKIRLDELQSEIDELVKYAKKALEAGNREDASVFVAKKQKLEVQLPDLQAIYNSSKSNADQMREMHNKLVNDVETMENRKSILKGKLASAKAQETVNKMGAKSSKYGATMGKMDSMEEKINKRFNVAMSEGELMEGPKDEAADLLSKYQTGSSSSVSSELDALEQELGLTTSVEYELSKLEKEI